MQLLESKAIDSKLNQFSSTNSIEGLLFRGIKLFRWKRNDSGKFTVVQVGSSRFELKKDVTV